MPPKIASVTILAASRRLAHALVQDHARRAVAAGQLVWRTPRILHWSTWLRQQWLERRALGQHPALRLLTPAQARVIWSDVVGASEPGAGLLTPAGAARLAARSWQYMQEYLLPLEDLSQADGAEAQALAHWCAGFQARCRSMNALDEADLLYWAHEQALLPHEPVALVGFDVVPPALRRLFDRWRAHGKLLEADETAFEERGQVAVVTAREREHELELAARWARAHWQQGVRRIGIVIPDLQARRAAVRRVFEDVFAPGRRAVGQDPQSSAVTIAAAQPLTDYPLVEAAMQVLQFVLPGRSSVHAGRLLRSPFLGSAEGEQDRRALADGRLRQERRECWDWFELERWAGVTQCERLQHHAREVCTRLRGETSAAPPSRWAERFHGWLKAAGWPGERTLSGVEHQTRNKFHAALAEFGTFDAVHTLLGLPAALARLQELLGETAFEPETPPGVVTVIDPTTVTGMRFDALWVAGLDAGSFPGPVSPDPLIPLSIQQNAGMPGACAEEVMRQARRRLSGWVGCAAQVVLSWPRQEAEAVLRPSALLAPWAPADGAQEVAPLAGVRAWHRSLFAHRPRMETFEDDRAPMLADSAARGGARTLELQSSCPFRAQAELRLGATALARIGLGIEPMDRGTILHRVLAEVWKSLGTQATLHSLAQEQLQAQVRAAAQRHVARALRPALRYRARLAALETEHVIGQVLRLLELEKLRAPFGIRVAEASEPYMIGGLAITLQPDRIDELGEGGQLLIDYKLGTAHQPRQWLDTWPGRPQRPQLPLYALAHQDSLRALAFIVLAPGTVEYRGWSDGTAVGPGVDAYPQGIRPDETVSDWPALLAHWRSTLTQLARAYVAGEAAVDPLPYACTWCHLSTMCRIHEHAPAFTGEDAPSEWRDDE
ncbi:hypothetical protein ACG33_07680 [Steroidobacter denitrificans]|uniref:PD-(D/E)XK endonuclease-like domain-containing protein n=1 Tax=Steroidobacter denitrificans TaxID=465721 RepID=A0A127F989_STEDE|nr:PD-(D/E)XK nuclease family protein [Steroidobacter denitrificans]AMN46977.1 hypothetical protein ACG33_07680 [Steroidobacter denitrificans]